MGVVPDASEEQKGQITIWYARKNRIFTAKVINKLGRLQTKRDVRHRDLRTKWRNPGLMSVDLRNGLAYAVRGTRGIARRRATEDETTIGCTAGRLDRNVAQSRGNLTLGNWRFIA